MGRRRLRDEEGEDVNGTTEGVRWEQQPSAEGDRDASGSSARDTRDALAAELGAPILSIDVNKGASSDGVVDPVVRT